MIWKPAVCVWSWNLTVAHGTSRHVSLFAFYWSSLWECNESGWTGGPVPAGMWTGGLGSSTTQTPCSGDFWWTCGSPSPSPIPSIPATSPNTVVHEYGWQAWIPGIINVPRGHINHITIKRPNAPKKCRDAIAHGRSREDKQFLRGGTLGCSRSAASSEIRALAILLCSCAAALTASNVSCDKAGCSYTRVRFILAEMLTGTRAQLQLT